MGQSLSLVLLGGESGPTPSSHSVPLFSTPEKTLEMGGYGGAPMWLRWVALAQLGKIITKDL